MDKDLILSEEKGERKLMVHDSWFKVNGSMFTVQGEWQVHGSRLERKMG